MAGVPHSYASSVTARKSHHTCSSAKSSLNMHRQILLLHSGRREQQNSTKLLTFYQLSKYTVIVATFKVSFLSELLYCFKSFPKEPRFFFFLKSCWHCPSSPVGEISQDPKHSEVSQTCVDVEKKKKSRGKKKERKQAKQFVRTFWIHSDT